MNKMKIHGIYRHFKGDYYLVEEIAKDSETKEDMVVYRRLYGINCKIESHKYFKVKKSQL